MNAPKGKYAWSATVGEKGQIVIPKQARELFGIRPGDTLLILGDEARGLAIPRGESLDAFIDAALGGIAPGDSVAPSGSAAPGDEKGGCK